MLSRARFGKRSAPLALVVSAVLGLAACAGSSDLPPTPGSGGNQSGTAGSGSGGTSTGGTTGTGGSSAGASGSGVAGSTTGTAGAAGGSTTGTGGSATGTGGSATGTAGSAAGTGGSATGTAGRGGSSGTAGTGGAAAGRGGTGGSTAGRGGTGGAAAGTTGTGGAAAGTTGTGGALIWPNDQSSANSDDWLVQHHDQISQLRPRVLAMDIGNTSNAMTLIQRHIDGLANATSFHKYGNTAAQPMLVYQLAKIVNGGTGPNYTTWNSQAFADSNIQMKDPKDPTGPNLTLCQLFEKGVINEVWCMATQNQTKCGETQETKQPYTNADPPVKTTGKPVSASNGDNVTGLNCKVSIRIIDFNTSRGVGCHQHAMGHGWERYMDANALPILKKQAARFLNWDLNTRVGAPFSNFYSACNSNGTQLTDCILWDSQIAVHNGPSAAKAFTIADMSGGCGNAHFYANTTGTYSYDANTPDPMVLSSCEHYGMHDGANGKDTTTPYTNKMTDDLAKAQQTGPCTAGSPYCSTDDDCGGHGTSYLYQSFPSYGTTAKNDDGSAMHNWWPYLFY